MEMEKVAAHHLLSRDERDDAQWTLKEGLKSKLDVCHMLPLHSPRFFAKSRTRTIQKLSEQSMSLIISLSCCPPLQKFPKTHKIV